MEYLQRVIIAETAKLIDINEEKNKKQKLLLCTIKAIKT